VGENTSTGATIEETVWLGDIPVASLRPNSPSGTIIYYVHTDQLNTPRKVTNNNSNLTLRWSWDPAPFGEGTNEPKESPTGLSSFKYNLRFPGQLFDAESNLYYNYFRDYDPAVGRYVESDPIGVSGGINTYAYVRGLPSSRIDPFGLCDDEEKKAECDQKLSDMLLAIFGRRLDGSQGPKGMAQRYQQMGRQLPDDVRKGYEEQFRNRQKNLRKRAKDYEDSGCGPPPLEIIEWMNKDVPTPPPPQADADGINGDWLLLLILIREASRLFPPSNLVPVL
jgi:RHS repeat-associated protein